MARKKGSGKMVGMTQISISLPESLVQQIDELAKMDNRNRSNFIANTLQNLAREQLTVAEAKKKIKLFNRFFHFWTLGRRLRVGVFFVRATRAPPLRGDWA